MRLLLDRNVVIRQTIIKQLWLGPTSHIHLHRECCEALDLSTKPKYDEEHQRTRICEDVPDTTFAPIFNQLINEGIIRKLISESDYVFYELIEERI